jgi:hypothetical protein
MSVLVILFIGFSTFQQQRMFRSFMKFQEETISRLLHLEEEVFGQ